MKNSTSKKGIIKGNPLINSFFYILLSIVVGFIIGVILLKTAPIVYNWGIALWKNFEMSHNKDIITDIIDIGLMAILGTITVLLNAIYFGIFEVIIRIIYKIAFKYVKAGYFVPISLVIVKLITIITPLIFLPSFYRSITSDIGQSIFFIGAFFIIGIVGVYSTPLVE